MSLYLILSPNLKTSSLKVSNLLREIGGGYETLLLNLPWEMEEIVTELTSNLISYDEFIHKARAPRHVVAQFKGTPVSHRGQLVTVSNNLLERLNGARVADEVTKPEK